MNRYYLSILSILLRSYYIFILGQLGLRTYQTEAASLLEALVGLSLTFA